MSYTLYIARRYLFAKKSTHAINWISAISVVGVAVATTALVVTLSVFNGFHDLVAGLLTAFDPQIAVVPAEGKAAPADCPTLLAIRQMEEVDVATECVEDQALAIYRNRQATVRIKGVDNNFDELTHINDILYGDGVFMLHAANLEFGVVGIRLADNMAMAPDWRDYLKVYAPRREGQLDMANPTASFVCDSLMSPGVIFAVKQARYDRDYIITSIGFARRQFGMQGMLTSLELRLKAGSDLDRVKARMQRLAGDKYRVLDRMEQQADTFRIMKIEKFIAYIFLTFILVVACFNIIGSLSMIIIDKKDDIQTLRNLGATDRQTANIFLWEGWMISAIGALAGIALGLLLCWLQQRYGLVALGQTSGSFIVDAYPVSVHPTDVVAVLLTVMAVGAAAVWWPVRYMARRLTD